jgi:hypothetical protein
MAAFDFPDTTGQPINGSFQYVAGGLTYAWNGEVWNIVGGDGGGAGGGDDLQTVTDNGNHTTNAIKVGNTEADPEITLNADGGAYFGGNVGIGTSSPTRRLQIGDDNVNADNVIKLGKRVTCSQTSLPIIGQTSVDAGGCDLGLCATSSTGRIVFYTGNGADGFGAGANEERMRIDASGNVGIGVTDPTAKVHIDGNASQVVYNIESNTGWDMTKTNMWTASGGTIVNPTNATAGQTGVIYCTGAVTAWGTLFKFPGGTPLSVPANSIVPYYISKNYEINIGHPTEGIS